MRKNLRMGVNLQSPWLSTIPYWGNWYRGSYDHRPYTSGGSADWGMARDGTTGAYRPGPSGGYVVARLTAPRTIGSKADFIFSCGPQQPNGSYPVSSYYGNAGQGTADLTPGWGYAMLPASGKIHVAWDYEAGQTTGTCRIWVGDYGTDGAGQSLEGQFRAWSLDPSVVGAGSNGAYRSYTFTRNDPINGLGSAGDVYTPVLKLYYTGYVTNIRVTVEADAGLDAATWNVNKLTPPLLNPWLVGEPLNGAEWIRFMEWSHCFDSGVTKLEDYTPYAYHTYSGAYEDPSPWWGSASTVAISAVTPYTGTEAVALRSTYPAEAWGGCPVKITCSSPHNLKAGCTHNFSWSGASMTATRDEGGTYPIDVGGQAAWWRPARPISSTELVAWLQWEGQYQAPEAGKWGTITTITSIGTSSIGINRRWTIPPALLGDIARDTGAAIHWCLSLAVAFDQTEARRVADAIAANYPANVKFRGEVANEVWNSSPPYGNSIRSLCDRAGSGSYSDGWKELVNVTAATAKTFRQAWTAAGLDADDVDFLVNVGPSLYMSETTNRLTYWNGTGDPLDRVGEVSVNTYFYNFGNLSGQGATDPPMTAFPGYDTLDADRSLDLMELQIAYGAKPFNAAATCRATLDAASLHDVTLTSYEGSLESVTVGQVGTANWSAGSLATQAACAQLGLKQAELIRHPRMAAIVTAAMQRLEDTGLKIWTWFSVGPGPQPGPSVDLPAAKSMSFWSLHTSFGERSGKGDGSDGLHDNRVTALRPYAAVDEGRMVNPIGYALRAWNAMTDTTTATIRRFPFRRWRVPTLRRPHRIGA